MPDKQTETSLQDRLHDGLDAAKHKAADAYDAARSKAGEAYDGARHKASDAVAHSRDAARRAVDGLEANPVGVLVGGLAVGALVGALIPRSDREKALLAPAGRKLGETARAAVQAARDAGYAELDQRGLTRHAAKDQLRGVADGLGKALSSAGSAAAGAATQKADA